MKPTQKQVYISAIISAQAEFWGMSNDINSPTHYNDIEQSFDSLEAEGIITMKESEELQKKLIELFNIVKNIK